MQEQRSIPSADPQRHAESMPRSTFAAHGGPTLTLRRYVCFSFIHQQREMNDAQTGYALHAGTEEEG